MALQRNLPNNNPATLVPTTEPANIAASRCISSGGDHILILAPRTNGKCFCVRNVMSRLSAVWISRGIRTQNHRDI
jgi:hypothetical protein